MRSLRPSLVASVVAAGVLLAACGGGADDASRDDARRGGTTGTGPDDAAEVVLPEPAPGPPPDLAVSPEAEAASPLPEIAVRRLNGDGGWVQFKDEMPADRPVLIWFWAPF
jgi:hypothetical protein